MIQVCELKNVLTPCERKWGSHSIFRDTRHHGTIKSSHVWVYFKEKTVSATCVFTLDKKNHFIAFVHSCD